MQDLVGRKIKIGDQVACFLSISSSKVLTVMEIHDRMVRLGFPSPTTGKFIYSKLRYPNAVVVVDTDPPYKWIKELLSVA